MAVKRFNVVLAKSDGGIEIYPMKEWLRQHSDQIPAGLSATSSTSHQLRDGLRRMGWTVQDTNTEVRLLKPDGSNAEIDRILGDLDAEEAPEIIDESADPSFRLEYQLRDFIAENLRAIDVANHRLSLYVDPTGRDGVEFATAVGFIDILAVDDKGDFYIFELKRANSPDRAIGQVARYMGWVGQTIGQGRLTRGIIVARKIDDKLRYAASAVPNVSLFEYEVIFNLHPANELPIPKGRAPL